MVAQAVALESVLMVLQKLAEHPPHCRAMLVEQTTSTQVVAASAQPVVAAVLEKQGKLALRRCRRNGDY
jgi:hypothetical protein